MKPALKLNVSVFALFFLLLLKPFVSCACVRGEVRMSFGSLSILSRSDRRVE